MQSSDATRAYIQSNLRGPKTWVTLPRDQWPESWATHNDGRGDDQPVVLLTKSLYGHPEAGANWEAHCNERVEKAGFVPIGDEWPSCFFHDALRLFLVVYADDFKLAGPGRPVSG